MKKKFFSIGITLLLAVFVASCSSDVQDFDTPMNKDDVNVLLIQSDNGQTSIGTMYGSNECYNPPHCYIGKEIRYNGNSSQTIYHMGFGANIKGSDVFDLLDINFESNQPMSFSNLKKGDTFDNSEFHAAAYYTPTWPEAVMKGTSALSGKVTVVGTKKNSDKDYMVLKLINLRFDAIDHSCVYTVNGTVEYEIYNIKYE